MRGTYPSEMRVRVIGLVEAGTSRREAAEQLEISASSAIRWMQRWEADRTSGPKPRGGSVSPLEQHAEWILAFVAEQSDLTLDEIVSAMHKKRICGSRTALWRFLARHDITVKKKPARGGTAARRRRSGTSTLDTRHFDRNRL
jgi:transposase